MKLRYGFKEEAKRLARGVRGELGLHESDRLDPWRLADHWGIPIHAISEQTAWGCRREVIRYFHGDASSRFSAALIPDGNAMVILENDCHASVRRRANVTHEMAHVILEHEFTVAILTSEGCRTVEPGLENEATWFAGELLIPYQAAVRAACDSRSDLEVARIFDVSEQFARMRMNASGARRIARRAR